MKWAHVTLLASLLATLPGCLFLPGPEKLQRMIAERPESPYSRIRFLSDPRPENEAERPLEELVETLEYWNGTGSDGRPRWEEVLVPSSPDLYTRLLEACRREDARITLVAYHYDSSGLDALTLVDYLDDSGQLLGHDHIPQDTPETSPADAAFIGYDDLAWWEYPMFILDVPVYLAIGLQELAGEAIKAPLSALDSGWLGTPAEGRNPLSPVCFSSAGRAFVRDLVDGYRGLTWRFRVRSAHTPLDLARDLLGQVPLVGPLMDFKSPPELELGAGSPGGLEETRPRVIAISQGIHAGDETEQYTRHLERAVKEVRPDARTIAVPFSYGGAIDVIWSLLNLSHGPAHEAAHSIVFEHGIRPDQPLETVGFSGGVQRFTVASKLLRLGGYRVESSVGVAGPMAGFSAASRSHLLLADGIFLDPVVGTARLVNFIYWPFPSSTALYEVEKGGGHHLPYIPHPSTRAPRSGYRAALEALLERSAP